MLKLGETKITKERFYSTKTPIKTWVINVDNIVILKFIEKKNNLKCLIGTKFDKAIRPLVLVKTKMSG